MGKGILFAAALAFSTVGLAGSAGAVGCISGAVAGGVAGHYIRTGPRHKRHTLMGAAAGCVAGHEIKVHEKRAAKKRAAEAAAAAHPH